MSERLQKAISPESNFRGTSNWIIALLNIQKQNFFQ